MTLKKIFVAMTGASGSIYGLRLVEQFCLNGIEVTFTASDSGTQVCREETGLDLSGDPAFIVDPVYHLALSFDPGDAVDRAAMEHVADRVIAALGLREHQILIVAHRDRDHPHMHLLINRVHPKTGELWVGTCCYGWWRFVPGT